MEFLFYTCWRTSEKNRILSECRRFRRHSPYENVTRNRTDENLDVYAFYDKKKTRTDIAETKRDGFYKFLTEFRQ